MLLLAVAVLGNQVLDDSGWSWGWGTAALAAVLVTAAWDRWRSQPEPEGRLRLADADGRPLRLEQIRLIQLGVTDSRFAGPDGLAPHITRPVDAVLGEALEALVDGHGRRVVVVQGERLAGTTHALAHAAQTCIPHWRVATFDREQELTLAAMVEQAAGWVEPQAGVVVWLDAISLDHLGQLTEALVASIPPRVGILATVHTEEVTGPSGESAARLPSHVLGVLGEHAVHLILGAVSPCERELIRTKPAYQALYPAVDDVAAEVLMGRLMISLKQLREALTPGSSDQAADRVALLRAATDWYRAQMPERLTRKALQELWTSYRRHLTRLSPRTRLPAENFTRALDWSKAPASAGRPQLLSATAPYRPHPLLAVLAAEDQPIGWPIAPALWDYAYRHLDGKGLLKLGYTALDYGNFEAASLILGRVPTADISLPVPMAIADYFYTIHNFDHCRHWLMRAVEFGHPDFAPQAMFNLGAIEAEQEQVEQACHWWVRAVESSHPEQAPKAMLNLGTLEADQGRVDLARQWFEQVLQSHQNFAPQAMFNLGTLERREGRVERARHWWARAVESGHSEQAPRAMLDLGILEIEQGREEQARGLFVRAVESGHPEQAPRAMVNLGIIEGRQGRVGRVGQGRVEQGRVEQARQWFMRAVESDHPKEAPRAMLNFGLLEMDRGRVEEARHWFVRTIESNHQDFAPQAMFNLGFQEEEQGRIEQARHWFVRAVESGHPEQAPKAMVNLGTLERREGRAEKARHWWARAVESSHPEQAPKAMLNLGTLEAGQGQTEQARHWYGQAVESCHQEIGPIAMVDLASLEAEQGRITEARGWFAKAAASTYPYASDLARSRLRDLDRREAELRRAEWYGKYGYMGSATDPITAHPPTVPKENED
ncbi:tetratricopeptide repeat protein [Nonomuraea sp. NPDC047897]|uniref:tetratricopeptide repeat protein n=1 Tax=Nonomuraea sp. NPDC047897 TaxID=3364346 RepID=UPI00371A6376